MAYARPTERSSFAGSPPRAFMKGSTLVSILWLSIASWKLEGEAVSATSLPMDACKASIVCEMSAHTLPCSLLAKAVLLDFFMGLPATRCKDCENLSADSPPRRDHRPDSTQ